MLWNTTLATKLPSAFQPDTFGKDIPAYVTYGEHIFRTLVFLLALLMPLSITKPIQKKGLILYLIGLVLYFASWIVLMFSPECHPCDHILLFTAPAYTPLLWLLGIGLIGDSFYFGIPFKHWYFILASVLFLIFHNLHTLIVYYAIHGGL